MLKGMARPDEAPNTPCGCYQCYRLFTFAEIEDFWDEGETPVCPCCGSDNVVISTADMVVDEHLLFAMRKTYH
jgi:NAD-dependent SIR2 family protein deacetylase